MYAISVAQLSMPAGQCKAFKLLVGIGLFLQKLHLLCGAVCWFSTWQSRVYPTGAKNQVKEGLQRPGFASLQDCRPMSKTPLSYRFLDGSDLGF